MVFQQQGRDEELTEPRRIRPSSWLQHIASECVSGPSTRLWRVAIFGVTAQQLEDKPAFEYC